MRDVNIDMKYSCDSYLLVNTSYETRHGNHPFGLKVCLIRSQPIHLLPVIIQRYYSNDDIVPDLDWQVGLDKAIIPYTGAFSHDTSLVNLNSP